MSVIPVKLTFEDTIRRFSVSDKCTFAELQSLLAKVLNVPITTGAYVIQYTDDENERVTVSISLSSLVTSSFVLISCVHR